MTTNLSEKNVGMKCKVDDNGNLHCDDGPAMIADDYYDYFYHGAWVTDEVEEWMHERNIDKNNMSEEDKLALSFFMRSFNGN